MHIHTYSVDLRLVTPSELLVIRPLPFGILAFQHFYTTEPWMLCCLLGYIISFLALFFFCCQYRVCLCAAAGGL